jgi:hypothetical protein
MEHPIPPATPETMEDLLASVNEDPGEWLIYLRNSDQYMRHLESEYEEKHAQEQLSQTAIIKRDSVIHYQEDQLQKRQQRITQLEIEKAQLAAAASPTVQTPRPTDTSTPVAAAEAYTGSPAGPTAPVTAPPSRTASLSERIPDPKEFDGSRQDLPRFIQQVYGKMNANADRFPMATSRMTYVAGQLTGKAYALMLPKIKYGIPQFVDYPGMLEYLERAFGDPDRIQNAQNKLFQLRQKQLDFSTYFAEFQRLALEAEMPESALVPLLFQGISRELQDMLLHNPAPSTDYTAYTHHLQTLDNRYRQHQQQVTRNRTTTRLTPATNHPAPAHTPTITTTVRTTAPTAGDPMDLSYARRSQGRKERNECFRCGASDHKVAQCPKPAPARPAQLREGRVFSPTRSPSPRSRRSRRSPSPTSSSRSSVKGGALI